MKLNKLVTALLRLRPNGSDVDHRTISSVSETISPFISSSPPGIAELEWKNESRQEYCVAEGNSQCIADDTGLNAQFDKVFVDVEVHHAEAATEVKKVEVPKVDYS